jgi:hypothetical protein
MVRCSRVPRAKTGCYQGELVSALLFARHTREGTHCAPSTDLMMARIAALSGAASLGQAMITRFNSAMVEPNFCASLCASPLEFPLFLHPCGRFESCRSDHSSYLIFFTSVSCGHESPVMRLIFPIIHQQTSAQRQKDYRVIRGHFAI